MKKTHSTLPPECERTRLAFDAPADLARPAIAQHLARCAECRAEHAGWQAMNARLAAVPADVAPDDLWASVMAALPDASTSRAGDTPAAPRAPRTAVPLQADWWGAAAFALGVACAGGLLVRQAGPWTHALAPLGETASELGTRAFAPLTGRLAELPAFSANGLAPLWQAALWALAGYAISQIGPELASVRVRVRK